MNLFRDMSIATKLPLIMVGLVVFALCTMGVTAYWVSYQSLVHGAELRLMETADARSRSLRTYFKEVEQDLMRESASPTTLNAMLAFNRAWASLGDNPLETLHKTYINDNPYPVGEKDELIDGKLSHNYAYAHARVHAYFRNINRQSEYYDVFLVDLQGNVVYSVFKEQDYATNLIDGEYAQSALGEAARAGLAQERSNEIFLTDMAPYEPSAFAPAMFGSTAIWKGQEKVGVLIYQLPTVRISRILQERSGFGHEGGVYAGESYAIGPDLLLRSDSQLFPEAAALTTSRDQLADALLMGEASILQTVSMGGEPTTSSVSPMSFQDLNWLVIAEEENRNYLKDATTLRNRVLIAGGISVLLIGIAAVFSARNVVTPILGLSLAMERITRKDFKTPVEEAERGDEIGEMGRILKGFADQLSLAEASEQARWLQHKEQEEIVKKLSTGLAELASGDLSCSFEEEFPESYEELRGHFNDTIAVLSGMVAKIGQAAEEVGAGANEIDNSSRDMAKRTETQATTLEESSIALGRLGDNVAETVERTNNTKAQMEQATKRANTSNGVIREMVEMMAQIEDSSKSIQEILTVIDGITFQTNLLALNAGVEAARAGDAGRGFSVVASEVRALAQRSAGSSEKIKSLIGETLEKISKGVELSEKTGNSFQDIMQSVEIVTSDVSAIFESMNSQSSRIQELNGKIATLERTSHSNAAMGEEAAASSETLRDQSRTLLSLLSEFNFTNRNSNLRGRLHQRNG